MIGQRKHGRNAPYKWFKLPRRHDSLSEPARVSIHTCYTLLFLLINTLLVSLLSVFVRILLLQSRRARALPLTTGLAAGIRWSHRHDPPSITGRELKPGFKPLQAEATRDEHSLRGGRRWEPGRNGEHCPFHRRWLLLGPPSLPCGKVGPVLSHLPSFQDKLEMRTFLWNTFFYCKRWFELFKNHNVG